jgi:hypothetical protein
MTGTTSKPLCPHCGATLLPFQLPDNTGWDSPIHFACFNDECPYFRRGWAWMFDHYGVKSSYRHRVDPVSGTSSPLPVWSRDAIKDRILDAEIIADPAGDDLSPEEAGNRQQATGTKAGNRQQATGNSEKKKDTRAPDGASQGRTPAAKSARKGRKP